MELRGAEIVLECLMEEGVDTIFGYPGGAVIPLYDALYDYMDTFTHIRTAHEQGAVHGADGYARATGKVGVCFATSGPGATNAITGIATAYMDSVPIIVFTGQVPSSLLGKDSFQEIDITGITLPITKHNYLVESVEDLGDIIREAFRVAQEGRPGPILIDIPKDIFTHKTKYTKKEKYVSKKEYDIEEAPLLQVAEDIKKSSRPIIYGGGGVIISDAGKELYDFAVKTDIPVVNTLMGLGSFPRNHPLSLGMVGMHGFKEANMAVTHSDLIIAVGARFSDRVIGKAERFAPNAKIIHIDIDKTEIGKNKFSYLPVIGDVKGILEKLINYVEKDNRREWKRKIDGWRLEQKENEGDFDPENILKSVNQAFGDDTIVVTDVGQHQMWTAQFWNFKKPRTFLSSGGLGTMGYGLGAAIGAQVGSPHNKVVHVTGDGSFRMNCNELGTVSKYNIPTVTLLLNNNTLGMVRQWQKMFQNRRYSETDIGDEVDYIKLAQAYGIKGYQAYTLSELNRCLDSIKNAKYPVLIECKIDKDKNVLPIVPPGKPIDALILE